LAGLIPDNPLKFEMVHEFFCIVIECFTLKSTITVMGFPLRRARAVYSADARDPFQSENSLEPTPEEKDGSHQETFRLMD
jgi:hypothetical protein